MTGLPIKIIKIYNVRVTDVVFEVEYLCNGWLKNNTVNANLVNYATSLTLDIPIFNFAFSPRLSQGNRIEDYLSISLLYSQSVITFASVMAFSQETKYSNTSEQNFSF